MKIVGVSMVRNEADIVEAFVRHNLSILDGMIVVDHGSADRTLEILQSLCAERLPLAVFRSDAAGYLQAEITTTAARDAFARARADAVFPLDADEFLRVPSRGDLERTLEAIPPGHHGWLSWPTYVPPLDGKPRDIVAALRAARRALRLQPTIPEVASKVVLTRAFVDDPDAMIMMGNHDVILGRDRTTSPRMPHVDVPPSVVEVCHVPIRSPAQFVVKMTIKRLARRAAGRDYVAGAPIQVAYAAVRDGEPLTPAIMMASHIAGVEAGVEAALSTRPEPTFFENVVLRCTPDAPADPLPLVLAAIERLARRAASARQSPPLRQENSAHARGARDGA